jgi:hypothetical protein
MDRAWGDYPRFACRRLFGRSTQFHYPSTGSTLISPDATYLAWKIVPKFDVSLYRTALGAPFLLDPRDFSAVFVPRDFRTKRESLVTS